MIYADYEFYKNEYHGTLEESEYNRLSVKASAFLDYYTMGKAKKNADLEAVKLSCCALCEKISDIEQISEDGWKSGLGAISGGKKSESVGSYSVTYQSAEEYKAALRLAESEKAEVARMYLAGTNLLYRGNC